MNVFLYDKYKKYGGNMLDIIYEDRNMIVVNKPAGQLVQSGRSFELAKETIKISSNTKPLELAVREIESGNGHVK